MIELALAKGYHFGDRICWPRNITQKGVYNKHMGIIGASGAGKSQLIMYLLKQLILHALKFPGKNSVILIDPHDTLMESVLAFIASLQDLYPIGDRVIIVEPGNQRFGAPGINVLEPHAGAHPFESISEIISACKAIWKSEWGPRLESVLFNATTLLQEHHLTLAQVPRLLIDDDFRRALLERSTNRDVKLYWEKQFEGFKATDQRFFTESTRNKISSFLNCPFIRPVLAQQRSTINFFEAMNSGKIILINMSRSRMKTEPRKLFGSLVLSNVFMDGIARERIPEKERVPVTIVVDEVQEVFNKEAVLPILEGGRKFNIQMIMAHQSLSQLDDEDVDIILANAATLVAFACGRMDAERLAREMWAFNGQEIKYQQGGWLSKKKGNPVFFSISEQVENCIKELMIQKSRECYIRLRGQGNVPYIATTHKNEPEQVNPELIEKLRENSARFYNRPIADINHAAELMEALAVGPRGQRPDEPSSFRE